MAFRTQKAPHEYGGASQPASADGVNSAIGGRLMVVIGGLPVVCSGQVLGGIGGVLRNAGTGSGGGPGRDRCLIAKAGRLKS